MIEVVVELALSNALISLPLAALAYAVHRHGRYPALAHLLWVAVLLKTITPPLLVIPAPFDIATAAPIEGSVALSSVAGSSAPSFVEAALSSAASVGAPLLMVVWLTGSVLVLVASTRRVWLFGRLLHQTSSRAPLGLVYFAASVGRELGLRSLPPIVVTSARISPMTWWSHGRVQLVVPAALLQQVDADELRWIVGHELAHLKRRDHLVRWIEWAASVAFWWNPVVWWARRNLRRDEEDACDALVVERLAGAPRAYAGTLLSVVEILTRPMEQVPMATGMDAARSLEHRLSTIVSARDRRAVPSPLMVGLTAGVVGLMALGFGGPAVSEAASGASIAGEPLATTPLEAPAPVESYATVAGAVGASLASDVYLGTAGADGFVGTNADEDISGFAGPDRLFGGAGRDIIDGGDGNDTLGGGAGRDRILGGAGKDTINGGAGRDEVLAGGGDDLVRTWADGTPDRVDCGAGNDRAVVDPSDTTRHCEIVVVREA